MTDFLIHETVLLCVVFDSFLFLLSLAHLKQWSGGQEMIRDLQEAAPASCCAVLRYRNLQLCVFKTCHFWNVVIIPFFDVQHINMYFSDFFFYPESSSLLTS